MKNTKFIIILALVISHISMFAQNVNSNTITPPPDPQVEGDGFGATAAPIDMYIYVLALAAIFMIAYFAKKYKTQKI